MPEYIPPIQNGAAEALAGQANNFVANTPSPWAALLQGIAPAFQAYGKGALTNYQNSSVPAQAAPSAPPQTQAQQFADPSWMAAEGW